MFDTVEEIARYLHTLTKNLPIDEVLDYAIMYLDSLQTLIQFDDVTVIELLMRLDNRFLVGEAIKYEKLSIDNVNEKSGTIYITRPLAKKIKEEGLHVRLTYFRKA